jgi:hypothetical protein
LLEERPFGEEVVMTVQQAPHTPPMWRKFLSLPHTRLGWVAVALAAPVFVFGVLVLPVMALVGGMGLEWTWDLRGWARGWAYVALFMLKVAGYWTIPAAVAGLIAVLRSHERSWLVWLALVPYLLYFPLVINMIVNIGGRHQDNPAWLIVYTLPVTVPLALVVLERVRRRDR